MNLNQFNIFEQVTKPLSKFNVFTETQPIFLMVWFPAEKSVCLLHTQGVIKVDLCIGPHASEGITLFIAIKEERLL